MIKKILVANRGEIAVRIIRTIRELGLQSVAAFSESDRNAPFVEMADEAFLLGPGPAADSYLNIEALLRVAAQSGVNAVHPGYGFLAENPGFARAVTEAGLTFIGPPVEAIELMGDKVLARQAASRLSVPVVPGTNGPVTDIDQAIAFTDNFGFPVAVKAAAGGGGRGIHVVRNLDEMAQALESSSREALAYFKNPSIYLERYFDDPRHVEIQVLGDRNGTLVHLGERDCSVQRKHQKLIEESPSPGVDRDLRSRMGEMALRIAAAARYQSAGTVEFLLDRNGQFYFLEMNTRIQVEHPVTEMVTGLDLIREMISIAAGETLSSPRSRDDLNGHAIEVRINAEDPRQGFRPSVTEITEYVAPGGPGVRVDSGVREGYVIPQYYDSLLAKLIVWAPDRELARRRMLRALNEYRIGGPQTTIPFARAVLESEEFRCGDLGTTFVEKQQSRLLYEYDPESRSEDALQRQERRKPSRDFDVEVNRKFFRVSVSEIERTRTASSTNAHRPSRGAEQPGVRATLVSPMHGTVLAIRHEQGEVVDAGETLVVIEAMKMENDIPAHRSGRIKQVHVRQGDTVETGGALVTFD